MRREPVVGSALLIVAACSFPGVTYGPADGAPDVADAIPGPDAATGEEGQQGGDALDSDATVPLEASVQDVTSETVFEAAPDSPECDQDHDGYIAQGSCGGNDCDDQDPHTNPGVTAFQSAVPPSTQPLAGDWNCDGHVTKQYATNLACSGNALLGCMNTSGSNLNGFIADPGCGAMGPYGTCMSSGGLAPCMPVATSNETQGCL
jgi:hypothetical protein